MWPATWDDDRRSADNAALMHRLEVLDDIIGGGSLQPTTSMNLRQFDYIYDRFTKLAKKHTEGPLFSEDEDNLPGNRCKLSYRHALLMSLMRKYGNPTQEQLAAFFGIDQSTVCRYLRYCDMIFTKILPTPDAVSRKIRNARTIKEVKKIVPDLTVIVDGTHIDIQRPTDKEPRKEAYSGKKKSFTRNTPGDCRQEGTGDVCKQVGARKHARPHHDKEQPTGSGNPDCQDAQQQKAPRGREGKDVL